MKEDCGIMTEVKESCSPKFQLLAKGLYGKTKAGKPDWRRLQLSKRV